MRLKLGNKEFELKPLTLNDWITAEDLGVDLNRLRKGEIKLRDIRTLCYVAIKKVDPSITEEWVGEHLSVADSDLFEKFANFILPRGSTATGNTSDT